MNFTWKQRKYKGHEVERKVKQESGRGNIVEELYELVKHNTVRESRRNRTRKYKVKIEDDRGTEGMGSYKVAGKTETLARAPIKLCRVYTKRRVEGVNSK